jgi:hypothetical protein
MSRHDATFQNMNTQQFPKFRKEKFYKHFFDYLKRVFRK